MSIEFYHEQRITHLENRVTFLESALKETRDMIKELHNEITSFTEAHGKVVSELRQIYTAFGLNLKEEP